MSASYDAVVLGGDLAGGVAATTLARGGAKVLLASANSSSHELRSPGTVLWGRDLEGAIPAPATGLPVERHLVESRLGFLGAESAVFFDFHDASWESKPPAARTLLRSRLEPWLAGEAERAGAAVRRDVRAVALDRGSGSAVSGVALDGERIPCRLVVVTDRSWGESIRPPPTNPGTLARERVATGLWPVAPGVIENRFSVQPDQGVALGCVLGALKAPTLALGSLATNRESLTLRVVVSRGDGVPSGADARAALDTFTAHPAISPLLSGSTGEGITDHAASLWGGPGALESPGLLFAGDAAGLSLENVLVTRDANYAVRSGRVAAEAGLAQLRPSAQARVGGYVRRLRAIGLLGDFAREESARRWRWNPRLHQRYPALLQSVFHELMTETGAPKRRVLPTLRDVRRRSGAGWTPLLRDALEAGNAL